MAFFHGIKNSEQATGLTPPAQVESGLIFAIGTAPVNLASTAAKPNTPVLCYSYDEAVKKLGYSTDFKNYTLNEVISSQFVLHKAAPIVFVNVLNPDKHFYAVTEIHEGITATPAKIAEPVILDTLKVFSGDATKKVTLIDNSHYTIATETVEEGSDVYIKISIKVDAELPSDDIEVDYKVGEEKITQNATAENFPVTLPVGAADVELFAIVATDNSLTLNEDYTAALNSDGEVVITVLDDTKIFDDTITVTYNKLAPDKVTKTDIIGGVDLVTGKNTGLECVEDVFPKFRMPVGIIIAPGFSTDVTVAAVMKAKATEINTIFNAVSIVDIPTDTVQNYTNAAEYKNLKNLIDTSLIVCYPKISLGGVEYHLSTQLASLMNAVDAKNDSIPYKSPSNERLQMDATVLEGGDEIILTLPQANYLNSQGIVTALNFANGWCAWGNRNSIYPSSTDIKDNFINIRRTFYWLSNTLILTYFSKIDAPMNKRLVESIVDSVNIFLNGLTSRGILNGGRIAFLSTENSTTDLMDGIMRFHLYLNVPSPAEQINFVLEYDPSYLQSLFS